MKEKHLKVSQVSICLILSLIVVFLSGMIISNNINYNRTGFNNLLTYNYNNNIDYKVNLKENQYYDDTIGVNKYISSLINNIDLNFKYDLKADKILKSTIKYKVISKLIINQNDGIESVNLLTDNNTILEETQTFKNAKIDINKSFNSNYDYYNNYVNQYKADYSLASIDAKIVYSFEVNVVGDVDGKTLNETSTSSITIPLLNPTISIVPQNSSVSNKTFNEEVTLPFIKNVGVLLLGIIFITVGIFLLIPLFMAIKEVNDKNKYRRIIKKYLRDYDEVIVESSAVVKIDDKELIEVTNFNDLLDAEQELHVPIIYTEINYNKEAWFTITTNNQVWRFILKNEQ